jgi:8-oxo-dGTP pyrophosphatase MutT (NUDIX family)
VPAGRALLEIPAGGLDIDATGVKEDPEAAARRELEEETGLRAGSWRHLASFYTAPGFTEELMHLFLATDLSPAHPDGRLGPDADERLVLEWLPWRDAIAAVERGDICDGKSLVGLLWLERLLDGAPATTAADTKSHTPGEPTGAIGDVVAITYRLSMREWVAANVALVRRSLGMRLFGLGLIALGIVGLWLTGDWISNGLALVLGVALLTGAFVAPFAWYQARRRRDLIFAEQSIEADANGLRFRGPTGTSSLSWDTFRRVHETRSYFFLDTNVGQNFVVPRRAFAPAELGAFYRLLQRAGLLAPTGGR